MKPEIQNLTIFFAVLLIPAAIWFIKKILKLRKWRRQLSRNDLVKLFDGTKLRTGKIRSIENMGKVFKVSIFPYDPFEIPKSVFVKRNSVYPTN